MALIRTAAEAKAAMPRVLSQLNATALIPDMDAAGIKYLVPLVGYGQYADIDQKINAVPAVDLSAEEQELLRYMRAVVAYHAYLDDLGTDNAKISDNGLRSTETANLPRVVGWQYKELKATLQTKAADAIEVLLRYLWENKDAFGLWRASEEYASFADLLIKTGTDFNQHYRLHQPMRTYYALKGLMMEVQDEFVKTTIGEDLLYYFVTIPVDDDNRAIITAIKRAVAYLTIYKACKHYSVRFDMNGFSILTGDADNVETAGRSQADVGMFELKMKACETDAMRHMNTAKKLLREFRTTSNDPDFNNGYDAGPLYGTETVTEKDRGNYDRNIFRF
jgi:hypothetical protein